MPSRTVKIGNLHLAVPGVSRDDAQRLGEDVARRLAAQLQNRSAGSIDALKLRVRIPNGTSQTSLAQTIAENIARRIR